MEMLAFAVEAVASMNLNHPRESGEGTLKSATWNSEACVAIAWNNGWTTIVSL